MTALLDKLHARLGDLWWYSLMIFVACRSGDVIQAFIGLWLVPKYVGPQELGAVLPLQQLASLFAVPLAIIATVFAKYVNTYATRGELGKVKSFIHDVLWASALVFLGCIVVAYLVIPHFYVRLNVTSGMLTVLILAAGFMSNISNLFNSALQGLKKFKTMTVVNLISAPIRLVTLLVAMPVRALSGYILGQATPPASSSLVAAYSLHRDLKRIADDTSWRHDLPEILRYLWPIAITTALTTLFGTILLTIYRQRLPEMDSATYYLFSRFSDIAGYIGLTMMAVMFPMAAESHEKGSEKTSVLRHTLLGTIAAGCVIAGIFLIFGENLLSLNDTWEVYLPYARLLPLMTLSTALAAMINCIVNYEMACRRFRAAYLIVSFQATFTTFLVAFTGYNFFRGILPDAVVDGMATVGLNNITAMTWVCLASAALQILLLVCVCKSIRR